MPKAKIIPAETQVVWNLQIGPRGYQCRITLKQSQGQDMKAYLQSVLGLVTELDALGSSFVTEPTAPKATAKAPPQALAPLPDPERLTMDPAYGPSFLVTGTEVRIENGKTLLKVRGGDWTKWGVNVWPEAAIASGIVADEEEYNAMDPRTPPDLRGWVAYYTTRTTKSGDETAEKVTLLQRYNQGRMGI